MDRKMFKFVTKLRKSGWSWRKIARYNPRYPEMDHVTLWHQYYRFKNIPFWRRLLK